MRVMHRLENPAGMYATCDRCDWQSEKFMKADMEWCSQELKLSHEALWAHRKEQHAAELEIEQARDAGAAVVEVSLW